MLEGKVDKSILDMMEKGEDKVISVIIQTVDGLKDEDKKNIKSLGGQIKDDLYIINAYSADIPVKAVKLLFLTDKKKRIKRVFLDEEVKAV